MGTVSGAALVGRAGELERLRECCRGIEQGAGTLVLIDGDAGTGKTRLVAEVMKPSFLPRGFAAVSAGALEYARAPYAPIHDALVALDKRFPKVLAGDGKLAAALRPVLEFEPVDQAGSGDADQRRVLDAVVAAFEKYSALSPIMFAVEDVHWIDRASADVLVHLSRRIAHLRALMLISFRPAEAREDAEVRNLLAQLSRSAAASFSLKPLSESDALLLIDDVAGGDLPMSVRRRICEMAEGNPLLLVEYAKLAMDSPQKLHGPMPVTLKGLVADRLRLFDPVDVDVLRVAAEMGQFELPLLTEIIGLQADRVLATLKKARNASIVEERYDAEGAFVFRHALIRHAISDELLAIERRDLNRRIAERLQRDAGRAGNARLAYHFRLAGETGYARAYSEAAAHDAVGVFAFSDAVQFFEHAIDDRRLDGATHDLYRNLAEAYALAQRVQDAAKLTERLYACALEQGDADSAADYAFELSRLRYRLLDDEGSITAIGDAIAQLQSRAGPHVLFNLYSTLAWYLSSLRRVDAAKPALERATALLEHGGDEARVRYYEARAHVKVHGGEPESYRDDIERALALAKPLPTSVMLLRLDNAIALSAASNLDDMDFAIELCGRVESAAQHDPAVRVAPSLSMAAWPLFLAGELARAHRALQPALSYAEESPVLAFVLAKTGIPLALQIDDPLLLRRCARPRLLENAFASHTPNVFGPVAAAIAMYLRNDNRSSEAAVLLEQTVKRLPDAANNVPLLIEVARANATRVLPRSMDLLKDLAPASRSARAGWLLCSAYLSRGEQRKQHAREAAQLFQSIRWELHAAEAYELAGETAAALEIYRRSGSVSGLARLEGRATAQSQSLLSKREWEVAGLVAEGKSNRSIADELVISERTVENHIASIFTKLNLRSRAEVAAHVARSTVGLA